MTTPALIQTEYATGQCIAPNPDQAGDVRAYRAAFTFTAAELVAGQIIEMGPLPAGCELVDAILDTDALDSNAEKTLTLSVGTMDGDFGALLDDSGNPRTCGDQILDAVTTGQAGGVVRPTLATAFRIGRVPVDTSIGLMVVAAPATPAAGTVGLTLIYRG